MVSTVIPCSEIIKCARVREFGFVEFESRGAASYVLNKLQGTFLQGHKLDIEWAMPPDG